MQALSPVRPRRRFFGDDLSEKKFYLLTHHHKITSGAITMRHAMRTTWVGVWVLYITDLTTVIAAFTTVSTFHSIHLVENLLVLKFSAKQGAVARIAYFVLLPENKSKKCRHRSVDRHALFSSLSRICFRVVLKRKWKPA